MQDAGVFSYCVVAQCFNDDHDDILVLDGNYVAVLAYYH